MQNANFMTADKMMQSEPFVPGLAKSVSQLALGTAFYRYEEKRRWTYSSWKTGDPLPSTMERLREVNINEHLTIGIATREKRILLHDAASGIVHLIPITNFYNELMLHRNIRDPRIALNSNLFFQDIERYADEDLRRSFVAYNKLKHRVSVIEVPPATQATGVAGFLKTLFGKQKV